MSVKIQFLGLIGSGKTYIANHLSKATGGCHLSFAKEVYRLAELVLGRPVDKSNKEDRDLLKLIGTTWGRESQRINEKYQSILDKSKPVEWGSPDMWIQIFKKNCAQLPDNISIFNDDTRFKNELEIVSLELGFIPFFILCRESTRQSRLKARGETYDPNILGHKSEQMINDIKCIIPEKYYIPVIWNDEAEFKPNNEWVIHYNEFEDLITSGKMTNLEIAKKLRWDIKKLIELLSKVK